MSCKTIVSLLMAGFFLCAASASAAPHTTLTIAMGDPESSEMGVVGNAFKKYVEDKTNGAIQVVCIYGGSPGDDEGERFRKVQKGTLDMALGGIANIVPLEKKLGLLTLPYLFANIDEVVAGTNGAPAELLNKYATKAGFRILTWTYTDFRYISNSKRPITKMADMQGLKFRVPQSAVLIAAYKAFGGSPTPISWAETFTALQQGVVDGQENPTNGINIPLKIWDYHKFHCDWHYIIDPLMLGVNPRVWKSFSPEDQKLLLECAAETEKYGKALSRLGMDDGSALAYLKSINKLPETTDCYAVMEANGMTVSRLSNEQIAALAKATEGVRKDWTAKIGADLVKAAEEDMASVR